MESVIFDGREYIKASVLAERFNYTQDYLGQLCRGKKVDARLVGRAWYLNLDSLQGHKKTRYKSTEKLPAVSKETVTAPAQHFLTRIDVEPVLKKKTVKILKNNKAGKLNEFTVKYENDDYSLIPRVNRASVSKPINILPAGADDLAVKATKESVRVTTFKAEPLPEVYLKGILKVDGIPELIQEEVESAAVEVEVEDKAKDLIVVQATSLTSEAKDRGRVDVSKPIKIKLYRNNGTKPEANKASGRFSQPVSDAKSKLVPARPALSQPRSIIKNQIPVKMALETSPIAVSSETVEIKEIPHANLKVCVILVASFGLAVVTLLPKQEIKSQGDSSVQTWQISIQHVQEVLSFLTSLVV